MSKYIPLNKNGFTPFANGRCQSLLQSTRMGSLESICIHKFNECIPEDVLIIWVLTIYLLVNAQWMYIQLSFQYVYFVSKNTIKQNYQTFYFELAHNKVSFVFYFKLNYHTLLFCILCLKINTITITIFKYIWNLEKLQINKNEIIFWVLFEFPFWSGLNSFPSILTL